MTPNIEDVWGQMGESWRSSMGLWSNWAETWRAVLQHRTAPAVEAMFGQFTTPTAWTGGFAPMMEDLERIFGLPQFADLPMLQPGALPSMAPMAELMAAMQQYLVAMVPVWATICQRFQTEVAEARGRGEAMDSAGRAMDLWNTVLDRTLMEFNRSSEFGALQQRVLRAVAKQKLEVRKLAERAAEAVEMPTRTEMDDAYERIHELKQELHALRREFRALKRAQSSTEKETSHG